MQSLRRFVLVTLPVAAALISNGCVTAPPPRGQAYSAGYVGDRENFALDETVLTIGVGDTSPAPLYNLHVRLGALVNPKDLSPASTYDVTGIINRLEPRMRARITEIIPTGNTIPVSGLRTVREKIAREVQATFAASYSKWSKASAFDVEIIVSDFYLTDLSVGLAEKSPRRWW